MKDRGLPLEVRVSKILTQKETFMQKPQPKTIERLDYLECVAYIEEKLGYELRDTLGKFKLNNFDKSIQSFDKSIEYRDFWHFIIDNCEIHNGCEIYMPLVCEDNQPWQNEILKAFHDEFGEEAQYWIWW